MNINWQHFWVWRRANEDHSLRNRFLAQKWAQLVLCAVLLTPVTSPAEQGHVEAQVWRIVPRNTDGTCPINAVEFNSSIGKVCAVGG